MPVGLELISLAFENNCLKKVQIDPYYQQYTSSLWTLVSGNVRFMCIFAGLLWKGGIKWQLGRMLTRAALARILT